MDFLLAANMYGAMIHSVLAVAPLPVLAITPMRPLLLEPTQALAQPLATSAQPVGAYLLKQNSPPCGIVTAPLPH